MIQESPHGTCGKFATGFGLVLVRPALVLATLSVFHLQNMVPSFAPMQVLVEGLPDVFAPFGSLYLLMAELLCTEDDRYCTEAPR